MPEKIIVYSERWCCTFEDFRPLCDSKRIPGTERYSHPVYDLVQCKHCGRLHEYYSFMDAAGSRDWNYRPVAISKKV